MRTVSSKLLFKVSLCSVSVVFNKSTTYVQYMCFELRTIRNLLNIQETIDVVKALLSQACWIITSSSLNV